MWRQLPFRSATGPENRFISYIVGFLIRHKRWETLIRLRQYRLYTHRRGYHVTDYFFVRYLETVVRTDPRGQGTVSPSVLTSASFSLGVTIDNEPMWWKTLISYFAEIKRLLVPVISTAIIQHANPDELRLYTQYLLSNKLQIHFYTVYMQTLLSMSSTGDRPEWIREMMIDLVIKVSVECFYHEGFRVPEKLLKAGVLTRLTTLVDPAIPKLSHYERLELLPSHRLMTLFHNLDYSTLRILDRLQEMTKTGQSTKHGQTTETSVEKAAETIPSCLRVFATTLVSYSRKSPLHLLYFYGLVNLNSSLTADMWMFLTEKEQENVVNFYYKYDISEHTLDYLTRLFLEEARHTS